MQSILGSSVLCNVIVYLKIVNADINSVVDSDYAVTPKCKHLHLPYYRVCNLVVCIGGSSQLWSSTILSTRCPEIYIFVYINYCQSVNIRCIILTQSCVRCIILTRSCVLLLSLKMHILLYIFYLDFIIRITLIASLICLQLDTC